MTGAPAFWKRMGRNSAGQETVFLPGRKWRGVEVSGVTLGHRDPPFAFTQRPPNPMGLAFGGVSGHPHSYPIPQKTPTLVLLTSPHLQASTLPFSSTASLHTLPLPGSDSSPPALPLPRSLPLGLMPFSCPCPSNILTPSYIISYSPTPSALPPPTFCLNPLPPTGQTSPYPPPPPTLFLVS